MMLTPLVRQRLMHAIGGGMAASENSVGSPQRISLPKMGLIVNE